MSTTPRYLGLNDFVEELARALRRAPWKRSYLNREAFCEEVLAVVRGVLRTTLDPVGVTYDVWRGVAEPGGKGITPTPAFGHEFVPDLVIDVGGLPTVAIHLNLVGRYPKPSQQVAAALGVALLHAHQYPAALVYFHAPGGKVSPRGLLDREIVLELWSSHKIRLVFGG
ncbi:MAG: hypothetical protein HY686_00835 [Chloroflexi bacterium]|nr:hypothetical protein [Chloroflexota bacterium]